MKLTKINKGIIFGWFIVLEGLVCIVSGFFLPINIRLGAIALGITILFGAITYMSVIEMRALTNLNFDEKMAMIVRYKKEITELERSSSHCSYELEYILDRLKFDLRAISHLKYWANYEKKDELISKFFIQIIVMAKEKDTCNNNLRKICELIRIGLEIIPDHEKLKNLEKEVCHEA